MAHLLKRTQSTDAEKLTLEIRKTLQVGRHSGHHDANELFTHLLDCAPEVFEEFKSTVQHIRICSNTKCEDTLKNLAEELVLWIQPSASVTNSILNEDAETQVPDFRCEKCGETGAKRAAHRKHGITLFVCIKRWKEQETGVYYYDETTMKIDEIITFEEQEWEIDAVIIYTGNTEFGHYVAHIKNHQNGKWFFFNDTLVKESPSDFLKLSEKECFALSYRKKNSMKIQYHQDIPQFVTDAMNEHAEDLSYLSTEKHSEGYKISSQQKGQLENTLKSLKFPDDLVKLILSVTVEAKPHDIPENIVGYPSFHERSQSSKSVHEIVDRMQIHESRIEGRSVLNMLDNQCPFFDRDHADATSKLDQQKKNNAEYHLFRQDWREMYGWNKFSDEMNQFKNLPIIKTIEGKIDLKSLDQAILSYQFQIPRNKDEMYLFTFFEKMIALAWEGNDGPFIRKGTVLESSFSTEIWTYFLDRCLLSSSKYIAVYRAEKMIISTSSRLAKKIRNKGGKTKETEDEGRKNSEGKGKKKKADAIGTIRGIPRFEPEILIVENKPTEDGKEKDLYKLQITMRDSYIHICEEYGFGIKGLEVYGVQCCELCCYIYSLRTEYSDVFIFDELWRGEFDHSKYDHDDLAERMIEAGCAALALSQRILNQRDLLRSAKKYSNKDRSVAPPEQSIRGYHTPTIPKFSKPKFPRPTTLDFTEDANNQSERQGSQEELIDVFNGIMEDSKFKTLKKLLNSGGDIQNILQCWALRELELIKQSRSIKSFHDFFSVGDRNDDSKEFKIATDNRTGESVFLKIVKDSDLWECAKEESSVLEFISKHRVPYCVQFKESLHSGGLHILVLPVLRELNVDSSLTKRALHTYLVQLLEAMVGLHNLGVVHLDLKPSNIMLDHQGNICVIDFESAQIGEKSSNGFVFEGEIYCGTDGFRPPEMEEDGQYGFPSDVYSFGITSLFFLSPILFSKRFNQSGWNKRDELSSIEIHLYAIELSHKFEDLWLRKWGQTVLSCTNELPNRRPSFQTVLKDAKFSFDMARM
eukprot:TRINITY_DN1754_c0_g1_i2.p1 TRINITY_DN1754_c0_g1~~TRINITY_DN1754_c0_g1_i2.p1  ORF type:complete len:1035 (-),score=108.41 TRINITY_DN1754_c0_g1_i2:61-3165(-)